VNRIQLPGLRADVPLGFLATIGLLYLATTQRADERHLLSWNDDSATPVLHTSAWTDLDDLADWLMRLVVDLPEDRLMPGFPPGFPPVGVAPDPLVPLRQDYPALFARFPDAAHIIDALVTDLAVNNGGRVRRTPMVAPTGKQSFYTMYRNQTGYVRAEPHRLREALEGWRRVRGCVAEGFDHAAIIGGADDPNGEAGENAVPGATWLAIAGLPAYRLAADSAGRVTATGWRVINRTRLLICPLWTQPLDLAGVITLLDHPATTHKATFDDEVQILTVPAKPQQPLGISRIFAARRRSTGNSEGPLTPVIVLSAQSLTPLLRAVR
jgi:hypothetical protein